MQNSIRNYPDAGFVIRVKVSRGQTAVNERKTENGAFEVLILGRSQGRRSVSF